jgi:hypothetical protein
MSSASLQTLTSASTHGLPNKILISASFLTSVLALAPAVQTFAADGEVDSSFNPDPNSGVYSLAVQADGKILIGGNFTTVDGIARNRIGAQAACGI